MRHQTKKHTLGKAQDQRKALLRSLATELFVHGEIKTTMARAKALTFFSHGDNIFSHMLKMLSPWLKKVT